MFPLSMDMLLQTQIDSAADQLRGESSAVPSLPDLGGVSYNFAGARLRDLGELAHLAQQNRYSATSDPENGDETSMEASDEREAQDTEASDPADQTDDSRQRERLDPATLVNIAPAAAAVALVLQPPSGLDATRPEPLTTCQSHRFQGQLAHVGAASGFLVHERIVATAFHVVAQATDLSRIRFAFDYLSGGAIDLTSAEVYSAQGLLAFSILDDWALIVLDRPVVNRLALEISEGLTPSDPLYTVGHPLGLPMKYSGESPALTSRPSDHPGGSRFYSFLSAMQGSSGSPVLNVNTGKVEGLISVAPLGFRLDLEGSLCWQWVVEQLSLESRATEIVPSRFLSPFLGLVSEAETQALDNVRAGENPSQQSEPHEVPPPVSQKPSSAETNLGEVVVRSSIR